MCIPILLSLALLSTKPDGAAQAKRLFAECGRKLAAAKAVAGTLVGTMDRPGPALPSSTFLLQKPRSFRFIGRDVEQRQRRQDDVALSRVRARVLQDAGRSRCPRRRSPTLRFGPVLRELGDGIVAV